MELIRTTNIDFLGKRRLAYTLSIVLSIAAFVCVGVRGMNYSIDFTGGDIIEISYAQDIEINKIRDLLVAAGFGDAIVQRFGGPRDFVVRIAPKPSVSSITLSDQVVAALPGAEKRRAEYVGPQVGEELTEQGTLAMLYALLGILIYVALRFEFRFAIGAVVATIHDTIVVIGALSLFRINFDQTTLAAILAVIGYSLNDTVVVFDRMRENFRKMRNASAIEVANSAINQTLSRTIMTGFTTLLVLVALFFLGGESLRSFSLTLIIGIFIGTYSSIYVAGAVALTLGVSRTNFIPAASKSAEFDNRP